MKHIKLIAIIISILVIAYSCKKTTTTRVEKRKAPASAPILAEVTAIVLNKMPGKNPQEPNDYLSWDYNQQYEVGGPDIAIDFLDSIPNYAVYQGGYVKWNLTNDSLPSTFGDKASFKVRDLSAKYHLIMVDFEKETSEEVMALLPFRLSDYSAYKPSTIILASPDSSAKFTLHVTWY